jgi:tRNA(Ile)-lysidine synthase
MKGTTLQEAAREARFSFFHSIMKKQKAHRIALGQTADDQAETMVMRFLRGAGLAGLKGIPPVRNSMVIHPLLEVRRDAIESYLQQEGLAHVEDSSNRKDIYLRNRVRSTLIPLLEGYNPNLKSRLSMMGRILFQEEAYVAAKTLETWDRVARRCGNRVILDLTRFRNLHPALQWRLLKRALESVSGGDAKRLGMAHVLSLVEIVNSQNPQALCNLPGGVIGRRIYERLEIGKTDLPPAADFDHVVSIPGVTPLAEIGKRLVTELVAGWDLHEVASNRAVVDFERLRPPLRIRNWRRGDRFRPLGMAGTKKISDCFTDWKVPREERARIPLLLSGDTIVWIVGYRIGEDVRVTAETKQGVRLEIQDEGEGGGLF